MNEVEQLDGKPENEDNLIDSGHLRILSEPRKYDPLNDPKCTHSWELDPSETDFLAYQCSKCKIGKLFRRTNK